MDPRLSGEEIDRLVAKLNRGEYLEDYYRRLLFRETKELELAYAAKQSKSEILSSAMAVPLQPLKRYGEAASIFSRRSTTTSFSPLYSTASTPALLPLCRPD
jgi:hypothetical protein